MTLGGKKPTVPPENLPGAQNGNFTFAPYGRANDAVVTPRPSGPLTRGSPPGPAAIPPTVGATTWRQSGLKGGAQMVTWKSLAGSKPWISMSNEKKTILVV